MYSSKSKSVDPRPHPSTLIANDISSVAMSTPTYTVYNGVFASEIRENTQNNDHSHPYSSRCSPAGQKEYPAYHRLTNYARSILSNTLSGVLLVFFVIVSTIDTYRRSSLKDSQRYTQDRDNQTNDEPPELVTTDESYYARRWGYVSEPHKFVTPDGYVVQIYRIRHAHDPKSDSQDKKKPVLVGHGLFQCSGAFIANEEQSLAFALVDQGYDVWLGNNRAVSCLEHVSLSHDDVEYWNWGLFELGIYDFPAMVDYIRHYTGYDKIGYIGHSQGNAIAFIGLIQRPELASKLSCLIALAPAVYAGNLITTFPIRSLIHLSDWTYRLLFGDTAFLPIMDRAQKLCHPRLFAWLGYSMFAYLFSWWDHHWLKRRKQKYFQFTPRLVSARLIADWLAGWGRRGVCPHILDHTSHNHHHYHSYHSYPTPPDVHVPLGVIYGEKDDLVNGDHFVRMFREQQLNGTTVCTNETHLSMLDLVHVERIKDYEHMDMVWAHDSHITTYPVIFKLLSSSAQW